MYTKIQTFSINILNSNYRFLFFLFVYLFIYAFLYYDKAICLCMNENFNLNDTPLIAEAKPPRAITRSIIQREVSAFVGYSETIETQKVLIQEQQKMIAEYKKEIAFNQDILRLIAGDDHVADAIADRGLQPYINKICEKHRKPLWYPWLEDSDQYLKKFN